jgi:hypothetical protein
MGTRERVGKRERERVCVCVCDTFGLGREIGPSCPPHQEGRFPAHDPVVGAHARVDAVDGRERRAAAGHSAAHLRKRDGHARGAQQGALAAVVGAGEQEQLLAAGGVVCGRGR